jgi:hypothetical protein
MSRLDRESLVALYSATDGQHWRQSTNWLSGAPLDRWFGVSTDDRGRVIGLALSGNSLTGYIPRELGNLSELESLDLSHNQLGRPSSDLKELRNIALLFLRQGKRLAREEGLPQELGNLYNLRVLNLSHNTLEWMIPPTFGNLENLERLDISYNNLRDPIPEKLGNLTNLKQLNLSHNRIDGEIPEALNNLTNLEQAEFGWQQPGGWG